MTNFQGNWRQPIVNCYGEHGMKKWTTMRTLKNYLEHKSEFQLGRPYSITFFLYFFYRSINYVVLSSYPRPSLFSLPLMAFLFLAVAVIDSART